MDKKEVIVGREFSVRDRTNKFIQSIFPKAPNGLYAFQSTSIDLLPTMKILRS